MQHVSGHCVISEFEFDSCFFANTYISCRAADGCVGKCLLSTLRRYVTGFMAQILAAEVGRILEEVPNVGAQIEGGVRVVWVPLCGSSLPRSIGSRNIPSGSRSAFRLSHTTITTVLRPKPCVVRASSDLLGPRIVRTARESIFIA